MAFTTRRARFIVRLAAASSKVITVPYTTQNDTATSGSDYTAASGNIVFQPGQTRKRVWVDVRVDDTSTSEERFKLVLQPAAGVKIVRSPAYAVLPALPVSYAVDEQLFIQEAYNLDSNGFDDTPVADLYGMLWYNQNGQIRAGGGPITVINGGRIHLQLNGDNTSAELSIYFNNQQVLPSDFTLNGSTAADFENWYANQMAGKTLRMYDGANNVVYTKVLPTAADARAAASLNSGQIVPAVTGELVAWRPNNSLYQRLTIG